MVYVHGIDPPHSHDFSPPLKQGEIVFGIEGVERGPEDFAFDTMRGALDLTEEMIAVLPPAERHYLAALTQTISRFNSFNPHTKEIVTLNGNDVVQLHDVAANHTLGRIGFLQAVHDAAVLTRRRMEAQVGNRQVVVNPGFLLTNVLRKV